MGYVPLVDVPARNGEAAVVFGSLVAGGFDVVVECDLRGWMHWYKPFVGLITPITIWVLSSQRRDALDYMAAPVQVSLAEDASDDGFWAVMRDHRRPVYAAAIVLVLVVG